MSYATQADLVSRFGEIELRQLTDRATPPAGVVDAAVVAEALSDAEATINSYISVRVAVPVPAPLPPALVRAACNIARYLLWKDRASEKVRTDYTDALKWCADVAAGRVALGNSGDAPTTPPSAGRPQVVAPPRKFKGNW
jgi:phage gp36-like protein